MLKVLAVDDQPIMLDAVKSILKNLDFVKLVGATTNAIDALKYCESTQPHVVLLDIDMPQMDGISLAQRLMANCPHAAVIFITSHSDYIRDAFKVYAFDFIEKPVDAPRLTQSLHRLYLQKWQEHKPIELTAEAGSIFVKPQDILMVEAAGKVCLLTDTHKCHALKMGMKEVEALLVEPYFFKSSRSFIINLNLVASVERLNRSSLEVHFQDSKVTAQLSKHLYEEFREKLEGSV